MELIDRYIHGIKWIYDIKYQWCKDHCFYLSYFNPDDFKGYSECDFIDYISRFVLEHPPIDGDVIDDILFYFDLSTFKKVMKRILEFTEDVRLQVVKIRKDHSRRLENTYFDCVGDRYDKDTKEKLSCIDIYDNSVKA